MWLLCLVKYRFYVGIPIAAFPPALRVLQLESQAAACTVGSRGCLLQLSDCVVQRFVTEVLC